MPLTPWILLAQLTAGAPASAPATPALAAPPAPVTPAPEGQAPAIGAAPGTVSKNGAAAPDALPPEREATEAGATAAGVARPLSPGPSALVSGPRSSPYRVLAEVFARYAHEKAGGQEARSFDIPRARLGADGVLSDYLAARALFETVRSAAPGSLYGVDGDSLVVRARELYGEARTPDGWPTGVRARLGLVPTLAITPLEQMWGRRVITPTLEEATGAMAPADLGASALVRLPADLGEAAVALLNGEGFTQREQNSGKTFQARLWLAPVDRWLPEATSVQVLLHYEKGSLGPSSARADRALAAVAFLHRYGGAGLDGAFLEGVQGNGDQHGRTATAWARVGPFRGFEVLGRLDQYDPNRRHNGGDDRMTTWQAGLGYHAPVPRPLEQAFEVYLTYRHTSAGALAQASDPLVVRSGPRLDMRVAF